MNGKKGWMKDSKGNIIAPNTTTDNVFLPDKTKLTEKIEEIENSDKMTENDVRNIVTSKINNQVPTMIDAALVNSMADGVYSPDYLAGKKVLLIGDRTFDGTDCREFPINGPGYDDAPKTGLAGAIKLLHPDADITVLAETDAKLTHPEDDASPMATEEQKLRIGDIYKKVEEYSRSGNLKDFDVIFISVGLEDLTHPVFRGIFGTEELDEDETELMGSFVLKWGKPTDPSDPAYWTPLVSNIHEVLQPLVYGQLTKKFMGFDTRLVNPLYDFRTRYEDNNNSMFAYIGDRFNDFEELNTHNFLLDLVSRFENHRINGFPIGSEPAPEDNNILNALSRLTKFIVDENPRAKVSFIIPPPSIVDETCRDCSTLFTSYRTPYIFGNSLNQILEGSTWTLKSEVYEVFKEFISNHNEELIKPYLVDEDDPKSLAIMKRDVYAAMPRLYMFQKIYWDCFKYLLEYLGFDYVDLFTTMQAQNYGCVTDNYKLYDYMNTSYNFQNPSQKNPYGNDWNRPIGSQPLMGGQGSNTFQRPFGIQFNEKNFFGSFFSPNKLINGSTLPILADMYCQPLYHDNFKLSSTGWLYTMPKIEAKMREMLFM